MNFSGLTTNKSYVIMQNERKPQILVLFYSMYGHTFRVAEAIAEGISQAGGEPVLRQVAELIPGEAMDESIKTARAVFAHVPVADPKADLDGIDGVVFGGPTRFGNFPAQLANFWDRTSGGWLAGTLIGKPGGVFTSSATQHGGQESTLLSAMTTLLHHGMVVVGLPYKFSGQMRTDELTGGSPYGVSTITGGQGERMPSENELQLARDYGTHFAGVAAKLGS